MVSAKWEKPKFNCGGRLRSLLRLDSRDENIPDAGGLKTPMTQLRDGLVSDAQLQQLTRTNVPIRVYQHRLYTGNWTNPR